jgi:hypothetical protein
MDLLGAQADELVDLLHTVPEENESFRYAPGKWSIKEAVGHVIDMERVFGFRLLHIARGASGALVGVDQTEYAAGAVYDDRSLPDILMEFESVRDATMSLIASLTPESADRTGTASGVEFTARALAWIALGHSQHHLNILRDRYLS